MSSSVTSFGSTIGLAESTEKTEQIGAKEFGDKA
jgi:hypothetical protein